MKRPRHISLAVISYSSMNREKYGIQKHIEAEGFQVMLLGYAVNDGEIHIVDLTKGENVPLAVVGWIKSPQVLKYAFEVEYVKRIMEKLFYYEVREDDYSWKSTKSFVTQYEFPADEMLLYDILSLEKPKCSYIDVCLKRFCEPECAGGRERRIYPQEFPALWRNVVHHCKWLVYMEVSVRKHLMEYPINEMHLLQEELECRYQLRKGEYPLLLDVTCSDLKYIDEEKLQRAIRFVLEFNECIMMDSFKIQYRNQCLWIMSPNGSFIMYINPCFEDEKKNMLRYQRYCVQNRNWEIQLVQIRGIVDDIYSLMENDYRIIIAMQCWYRNIRARVVGERLCVALEPQKETIIHEIIERTRLDG